MPDPLSARAAAAGDLLAVALGDGVDTTELDRLTARAAASVGCVSAQVSLMTDRHVAAAAAGPGHAERGRELPFDQTMCAYALTRNDTMVVPDAATDPRVASLDAVTTGQVRSYLGVPLRLPDGVMVGVLCVHGPQPRTWSDDDVDRLSGVGVEIVAELGRLRTG